jgi:hypothetical protein
MCITEEVCGEHHHFFAALLGSMSVLTAQKGDAFSKLQTTRTPNRTIKGKAPIECRASPALESTYNIPPSTSSTTCRKKRRKIGRREAIKFIKIISFPGYLPEQGENF